jgi:hypothetical protein
MSLDKLNKDIYNSPDHGELSHAHDTDAFDPLRADVEENPFVSEHEWQDQREAAKNRRKLIWKIVISVVATSTIIFGSWYLYGVWKKNSFHEDKVTVSIDGPQDADSTQLVKYTISYANNNRVTLRDAEVYLTYAENFQPVDNLNFKYLSPGTSKVYIGDLKPKQSGSIEMKGVFYAPKEFQVYVRANLRYKLSDSENFLEAKNQFGVNIATAPIVLDVVAPREATNGDSIECVIDYKNLDVRSVNEGQVRVEYPEGFQFVSATPAPSEGNSAWYVGTIEQNQGGKIRIQGKISGNPDQIRTLKVSLGKGGGEGFIIYNQRSVQTKITKSAFAISQQVVLGSDGKTVKPGSKLSYIVKFKNTSDIGLRNAIVTVELSGRVLDFSELEAEDASLDESRGVITWKASDLPMLSNLEPGKEGQVKFTVPVKAIIPVENESDKNYVVRTVAKIDSEDIPTPIGSNKVIGTNILELKLGSKVIFETLGFYNDKNIQNSGPIPPKVGEETTFTLHWALTSVSNDLDNAVVTASLPSGVIWKGKIYPENENITYDNRSNAIVWNAGKVPAGSGISKSKREVSFQIGITPQSNQVDTDPVLLNASVLTAKDTFTNEDVRLEVLQKNSQLREDSKMDSSAYRVVE